GEAAHGRAFHRAPPSRRHAGVLTHQAPFSVRAGVMGLRTGSRAPRDRSRRPLRMAGGLKLSPCVEWLFADGGRPFAERIRAAATAGFRQVEFWTASNKDIVQVEDALRETGVAVTCFVSEPTGRLVDPKTHTEFLEGIERSTQMATRLEARSLIVVTGDALPGVNRMRQHDALN